MIPFGICNCSFYLLIPFGICNCSFHLMIPFDICNCLLSYFLVCHIYYVLFTTHLLLPLILIKNLVTVFDSLECTLT